MDTTTRQAKAARVLNHTHHPPPPCLSSHTDSGAWRRSATTAATSPVAELTTERTRKWREIVYCSQTELCTKFCITAKHHFGLVNGWRPFGLRVFFWSAMFKLDAAFHVTGYEGSRRHFWQKASWWTDLSFWESTMFLGSSTEELGNTNHWKFVVF